MSPDQAPLQRTLQARVGALAATVDAVEAVGQAPFAATVASVSYVPDGAVSGQATNNRTFALVNETQSLTVGTITLISGVNLVAETPLSLTLSGTPANLVVNQGDVLAFTSTHAGTGLADPGGLAQATLSRS